MVATSKITRSNTRSLRLCWLKGFLDWAQLRFDADAIYAQGVGPHS